MIYVSSLDKILFVKNLLVMMKAGLPAREAMILAQKQARAKGLKKILTEAIKRLENGEQLWQSLNRHEKVFGVFFINILKVGEASGTLEKNLEHLGNYLENSRDLRRKIKGAMMYPLFILLSTVILGFALTAFVLPKLTPLFNSFNVQLPWPTRVLMKLASVLEQRYLIIFIGLLVLGALIYFISRLAFVKKINHRVILSLPIFAKVARQWYLAQITRTLGILLQSGIPVIEAMEITRQTVNNFVYKKMLGQASLAVQQGEMLSVYFKKHSNFFTLTVANLVEVGENTGRLEETLSYLADYYSKEIDNTTKNLPVILEPLLLVTIGIVVGFVAVAVIMPIYQLTRGISR